MPIFFLLLSIGMLPPVVEDRPLAEFRRAVFLGDSITYSGQYVDLLEMALRLRDPSFRGEVINLGLPSETVSGLTEPGHAGGQFPRPELLERLDRILERLKPDLVVACYGMNDGIYYPFDEGRFARYQAGIRHLRDRAMASGARVLILTPPVFDRVPIQGGTLPAGLAEYPRPFEGYDDVLTRYSDWLIARKADGWNVVDIHGPMRKFLDDRRMVEPDFRLAGDGVHIDSLGHRIMAQEVWRQGFKANKVPEFDFPPGSRELEVLKLVGARQAILKAGWLTEIGHKRPGLPRGLNPEEAARQAAEIEAKVRGLIDAKP